MSQPIRIADLRLDDIQRYPLVLEGLALAHWQELPAGVANGQLPRLRALADEFHHLAEAIAIAWAVSGVEGIDGVSMEGDEGEEWGESSED